MDLRRVRQATDILATTTAAVKAARGFYEQLPDRKRVRQAYDSIRQTFYPVTRFVPSNPSYSMASYRSRRTSRRSYRGRRSFGGRAVRKFRSGSTARTGFGIPKRFSGPDVDSRGRLAVTASKYGHDLPFARPARAVSKPMHFQLGAFSVLAGWDWPVPYRRVPFLQGFTAPNPLIMIPIISRGESLETRSGNEIRMQRLELRGTVRLGQQAPHGVVRFSVVYDKSPVLGATTYPALAQIYDARTGGTMGANGDAMGFPDVNGRDRFEILYQETFSLARGASDSGTPTRWHTSDADTASFHRDIFLGNRVIRYGLGTTTGDIDVIVKGCLYLTWQCDGTLAGSGALPIESIDHGGIQADFASRLTFVDN